MKANDKQVAGNHYSAATTAHQHWDIVNEHGLDYFQGQITKYVMRWKNKNGVEDLKKAQHFLEKYIELSTITDCTCNKNPNMKGHYPECPLDDSGAATMGYVNQ